MTSIHKIQGGGDLELHVREWGDPDGIPILLIHGWSGNHMAWTRQYNSSLVDEFRLVALDLRGHGMSDAPLDSSNYADTRLWADDIAAIIERLELERPVLVGWSYGGIVISDYIRAYGHSTVSGVNFVGGAVNFGEAAMPLFGSGFLGNIEGATQLDLPTNIETMRKFLREMTAEPLARDDFEEVLAFNMVVAPEVRAGLISREIDSDEILGAMTIPALVTQGREDRHVLPAMAEHILEVCPSAEASWYEGVAHMPFMEAPERFNSELSAFAVRVR